MERVQLNQGSQGSPVKYAKADSPVVGGEKKHCDKHNIDYEDNEITFKGKVIARIECPKCAEERADRVKKNADDNARNDFIKSANIEPAYYNATFETFNTPTPELIKAVNTVKRLVAGEIQQIVMIGKNGTGKTHLGIAAIQALGEGCIFSMYEISTRIRETYTARPKETELQVVNDLSWRKLLVIDEIGRTKGSETEANWLSYIIDKRISRNLRTILISNKHDRKTCDKNGCDNCLENYIGEDIMSRLFSRGVLLRLSGDDFRRKQSVGKINYGDKNGFNY